MSLSTRRRAGGVAAAVLALTLTLAACGQSAPASDAATDPIKIGSLLDQTGELNLAGKPMQKTAEMAVAEINKSGGAGGRQLELVNYDPQSDNAKYAQYAQTLSQKDKVNVLMGGITSASREAVRPVANRTKTPYFYNEPYEGGVCDRNAIVNGATLGQTISPLIPYGIKEFGPKVYVVAADYNFGHNAAKWVQKLTEEAGGTVLGTEFVPLGVSDFGSVINNIQREKPDFVASMLVGTNHLAFYRNFAAAGLNEQTPILSETFGLSGEHLVLDAKEAKNIYVAASYYAGVETPENEAFKKLWEQYNGADYQDPTAQEVDVWNGYHFYKMAVEKAGTTERGAVLDALESGLSFDGPGGKVSIDPQTHHTVYDVHIAQTNADHGFDIVSTSKQVQPEFEQSVCNLQEAPDTNKQFTLQ